ncbi:MAG TPA: glycosyltransferase family 2 protein [Chloroflexia bacterium]|nr:glycosyltransferase family 2 protein [Chloroflexia bacterium]
MPKVDIIIPNWNGREWLEPCLNSLRAQTFKDFSIIVVDNGSTDGSVEYIKTAFPEVKLVELGENRGFTGGINAGIAAGSAPFVCWFNNDAEATPAFLEELVTALEKKNDPSFGMASPLVLLHKEPTRINSAGMFVGPDGIGRERAFGQKAGEPFNLPTEVFAPTGTAGLYRREIFEKVGCLDQDFFLYAEDLDLNYRAHLAGYRCLYVPSAIAYHRVSAAASRISALAARLASRNAILAIAKNWPGLLLLKYLPWLVIGQFYQLLVFARRGQFWPALRGKVEGLYLLPRTLAKRRNIQQQRRLSLAEFERRIKLGRTPPRFWQALKALLPLR